MWKSSSRLLTQFHWIPKKHKRPLPLNLFATLNSNKFMIAHQKAFHSLRFVSETLVTYPPSHEAPVTAQSDTIQAYRRAITQ